MPHEVLGKLRHPWLLWTNTELRGFGRQNENGITHRESGEFGPAGNNQEMFKWSLIWFWKRQGTSQGEKPASLGMQRSPSRNNRFQNQLLFLEAALAASHMPGVLVSIGDGSHRVLDLEQLHHALRTA